MSRNNLIQIYNSPLSDLKELLEEKVLLYNQKIFIENDPIQIPYQFSKKEDIEIAGLFTAILAWGKRNMIIKSANDIMQLLDYSPYDFIINHQEKDTKHWKGSIHRTFNADDLRFFCSGLQHIYKNHGGLENVFKFQKEDVNSFNVIENFRNKMMEIPHLKRSIKHLASPQKGSAAKRINMYLRWMVRNDGIVDFGIWKHISSSQLSMPVDVHSGKMALQLGLISKSQYNWKTVMELDINLRALDPEDPVKYDFALFGMGLNQA